MPVYTYFGNIDPREKTERLVLRDGLLIVNAYEYANFTAAELEALNGSYRLVEGAYGSPAFEGTDGSGISFGDLDDAPDLEPYDVPSGDPDDPSPKAIKSRRAPIADKVIHDVRERWAASHGTSTPEDIIGYIHDGLARTAENGGWLLIPDNIEGGPYEISEPIVPPPNSRMKGPGMARFSERSGRVVGSGAFNFTPAGESIGEAWIRLKSGSNCSILTNDYDDLVGKRGPDRGNGVEGRPINWQWFTAHGIVFDHNGANQSGDLRAIDIRHAWGMNFPYCRLVLPRGRGWSFTNCNDCSGEKAMGVSSSESIANGVGDLVLDTNTVLNATGTWAVGDQITRSGITGVVYITDVVGTTLTLSSASAVDVTGTGLTLSKTVFITTEMFVLEDSTVDTDWIGVSFHGYQNGVVIDGGYGNRISGLTGYGIGGHNVWLRDTEPGSAQYTGCHGNKIEMRVEQATKHNVRIDSGCHDNVIDVVAFSPGLFTTPADSDAGWVNVFCDGKNNVIRGTGYKGNGSGAQLSAVVAYGPNAEFNEGQMGGGSDITAGTPIYAYRTADLTTKGRRTNTEPSKQKGQIDTSRVRIMDDFLGDVLADQWNGRVGSDPQCVLPTIQTLANGVVRLTTGDDAAATMAVNGVQLDSALNWNAGREAIYETSLTLGPGTAGHVVFVGLTDQVAALEMPFTLGASDVLTSNASNASGLLFDTAADTDTWHCVGVKADVDATKINSGSAPVAGTYQRFKIMLLTNGAARFYLDGVLIGTMLNAVTNTTLLTPVVAAFSRTTASRTIDVDYLNVEQYR